MPISGGWGGLVTKRVMRRKDLHILDLRELASLHAWMN